MLFKRSPRDHFGNFDFINDIRNSFSGIRNQAGSLVKEATTTLDTSKRVDNSLKNVKSELESDYKREDIADELGDGIFANEFASQLWEDLTGLENRCS